MLELSAEDDVVILEESGETAELDLFQRVEDLLGKTGRPRKRKSVKFKDKEVKETFLRKESRVLQEHRTTKHRPKIDLNDFRIEVSEPGQRKIINMSESGSSDAGALEMQEAALDAVMAESRRKEAESEAEGTLEESPRASRSHRQWTRGASGGRDRR